MIVNQVHDHLGHIPLVRRPTKYQDLSVAFGVPLINVKQCLRHTLDVRDVLSARACAGGKEAMRDGTWKGAAAGCASHRGTGWRPGPEERLILGCSQPGRGGVGVGKEAALASRLGPLTEDGFHQPRLEVNCLRSLQVLVVEPVGPLGEVTEHLE